MSSAHRRDPERTPVSIGVSPFMSNSSGGGFGLHGGARFSLSAAPSLRQAHPATPHAQQQPQSPQSPQSPASQNASPRSPASPYGAQQSAAGGWASGGWTPSAAALSPPRASVAPYGASSSSSGWGSVGASPPALHQRTPSSSMGGGRATSGGSGSGISAGVAGPASSSSAHATRLSSSSAATAVSAAKFSHPDLERIAQRLQMVAQYKTLSHLLLSGGALLCAAVLLLYLLVKQLPVTVDVGVAGLRISRDWAHGLGAMAVALMAWMGARGLHLYATLQPPVQEIEQLSERQRALMGWSSSASGAMGSSQRYLHNQLPEERVQDRNALRARARVQQLTGATAANVAAANAAAASSRTPTAVHSGAHTSSSGGAASSALARALSPVPATSLRFLGASGSPLAAPRTDSPYGSTRVGLDTPSRGGGGGAARIHDEASLGHWARDFDVQRAARHADMQQHSHTTPLHAHGHAAHGMFHTPTHAHTASHLSPRGPFGGLFGFGGSSAAAHTPPYATSMRESPATVKSSSALSSSLNLGGSGGLGLGAHGGQSSGGMGGVGGAGVRNTFSFPLPGHRFPLDDPRSDPELHDSFELSLRSLRITPAQMDAWCRSLRVWLAGQVLRPLLRALDESNVALARFASIVLAQPGVGQALTAEEMALLRELANAYAGHGLTSLPPLTARLADAVALLCARFPTRAEALQRGPIDKFLAVEHPSESPATGPLQSPPSGFGLGSFAAAPTAAGASPFPPAVSSATRAFVSQRLHSLCAPGDDALSKFMLSGSGGLGGAGAAGGYMARAPGLFGTRSGGGGLPPAGVSLAGAGGIAPFPSDAQIVLHCVCVHAEAVQPAFRSRFTKDFDQCTLTHAQFSATGLAHGARSPSAGGEHVAIAQVRPPTAPAPYFVLTAAAGAREGVKLVTEPGRASCFQALAMWVLHLPKGSPLLREFAGAGISLADR